ncbi:hypothetical protein PQB85_gp84 [Erwinia phage Midgardsormr38]|uniref:Uncharacterized protein n=1 Tax=Erwinia phage Midgardsormr38 TaxID=2663326 RepID=A0A5Q2F5U6_9CAUD|nr:hypothetical protein PQB85_gp84 [Erwinia phage Midgardsormr38]QGF22041.1 hypothetical protein [Erwinia phage Midgardsormr38]
MPLQEYIQKNFASSAEFARACGVLPQQVNKWLDMGCIVVSGKLYSPRREIP